MKADGDTESRVPSARFYFSLERFLGPPWAGFLSKATAGLAGGWEKDGGAGVSRGKATEEQGHSEVP